MARRQILPPVRRSGSTTVTKAGLHRKTVYFDDDEWEAIRRRAFEDDRAYTDVVRQAVRRYLALTQGGTSVAPRSRRRG